MILHSLQQQFTPSGGIKTEHVEIGWQMGDLPLGASIEVDGPRNFSAQHENILSVRREGNVASAPGLA